MYQKERQREILDLLSANGYITVKELSSLLYTSESSIRRDLTAMESMGLVKKNYGGVELVTQNPSIVPFSSRRHYHIPKKKIMAKKAMEYVHDGQIVFLDQSSSALFVAYELMSRKNITIVTNNIEILSSFSQSELKVYASGGYISQTNRNCLIGEDAHNIFSKTHADLLFFSAKALSPEGTIYDFTREEIHIRNTMMQHAAKKIFLCDSDKFDTYAGYEQCSLSDIDGMICENDTLGKYEVFFS